MATYTEQQNKDSKGRFVKGHKVNDGRIAWNKGSKMPQISGKNNYLWKGNNASYISIHNWVRRYKGIPFHCEKCGKERTTPYSIQWANIDHKYRRVLDDFIALCVKCHRQYDREHN